MFQKLRNLLADAAPRPAAQAGWVIAQSKASLIWDDPQPLVQRRQKPASAKSVMLCPAAIDVEARHFAVPCPIDLRLRVKLEDGKPPSLENVDGLRSTIRGQALGQMVSIISRAEWRHPSRPILQFRTPYVFVADEPVYLNQLPPFMHFAQPAWPGLLVTGRFPIHIWPRHLMWAFEWHDLSQELVLTRGQPWFYVRLEARDLKRPVRLVEAELTPELERYIEAIGGVTNYVNRTFGLFERAARRRPRQLLRRRERPALAAALLD
ncbi:MAG: hypothetical protein ACRYGM_03855 [Janthinobacterium lividum]